MKLRLSAAAMFAALMGLAVQDPSPGPAQDMVRAATAFWEALTPDQQAKSGFAFDEKERLNWHFIPKARKGLPTKEMTPPQRELALELLKSGLSQIGVDKATTIMQMESILGEMEKPGGKFSRDPGLYYFSIFGKPGLKETWAWRAEGHHLSLNFTLSNSAVVGAPSFFGVNPAKVPRGPRQGLRALPGEEDLARQLVTSLDGEKQKIAIANPKAPADIITGAERKVKIGAPIGISADKLNPGEQETLQKLIKEYVLRHRSELADQDLRKIHQAWPDKVFFAWMGGTEPGQGHYYRIQGPTFLIEYDNTQNNANHIHSVWRDLENDFGEDLLRRHYEETPHK